MCRGQDVTKACGHRIERYKFFLKLKRLRVQAGNQKSEKRRFILGMTISANVF
jgi:hypothetical protein